MMEPRPKRAYKEYFEPNSDVNIPRHTLARHTVRIEAERQIQGVDNDQLMASMDYAMRNMCEMEIDVDYEDPRAPAEQVFDEELENDGLQGFNIISQSDNVEFRQIFEADDIDENLLEDSEPRSDHAPQNDTFYNLQQYLNEENKSFEITVTINKRDVVLKILKHAIRHKKGKHELMGLMQLFNDVLQIAVLPGSIQIINKLFTPDVGVRYHAMCKKCNIYVGTFDKKPRSIVCSQCNLNINLMDEKSGNFLITFDIKKELQRLMKRHGAYYKYVVQERVHTPNVLKDMFDGVAYRQFVESLPDDEKRRYLTMCWNTDGAPVYESASESIYPIFGKPNEFPEDEVILCALWFGKSKPPMNAFLVPFINEMNELTRTGIPCDVDNEELIIKPYFICCCVDSVARPQMQNFHQFNGYKSCSWCLHPGKVWPGTKTMKFPLLPRTPLARTHEGTVRDMEQFENKKATFIRQNRSIKKLHVNGIIGTSPLPELEKFDIIEGFVPDYMHCCILGITKQFNNYWFEAATNISYSLKEHLKEIDKLLLHIRPHSAVKQLPRSLVPRKVDKIVWKICDDI